ncbi:MAG: DUF6798 domain-containing protein [Planctomycetota bacterium]
MFPAACLLFAGAVYQWPLYSSNQNTYFVPGLAAAGYGHLADDWLAQQSDIVPVFSAVVRGVHAVGSEVIFYGLFVVLAALYAACLSRIAATPGGQAELNAEADTEARQRASGRSPRDAAVFLVLLAGLHFLADLPAVGGVLGAGISRVQPFGELAVSGVAAQDVLGHALQPSAFGVLLLASVVLFVSGRPYAAAACAVLGATFHTSLTLHAGFLTVAYLTALLVEKRLGQAVKTGFVALGLVLPMTIYLASRFVFSDDDAARAAGQLISADVRQPHHAKPELWFDRDAMIQLVIVLAGLILSYRNKRLFVVLLVCTLLAGGLTVLQVFTGDLSLALMFPWRTSVWLVPACSAVLLGYAVRWIGRTADRFVGERSPASATRGVTALAAAGLIGFCLIGVQRTASNLAEDRRLDDHATFAKSYARPGQAYLIPTHLQRFRLRAGVPTYVDWKSFPYRSSEILVWHDRFETAEAFYAAEDGDTAAAALAAVQENQTITHVVLPVDRRHLVAALDAAVIYEGEDYLVVELADATRRSAIAG